MGAALQVVLDTLEPRERLAFVLHDLFGVPFDEVAPVVGASTVATRQLASRARRRVQCATVTDDTAPLADDTAPLADDTAPSTDDSARRARHREIVAAFFAAAREARFGALLELLDPDVAMRGDAAVVRLGGEAEASGADAVARWICGRAQAAQLALIDGEPGAVWAAGGKVRVAFGFTFAEDGRIARIDLMAEPEALGGLDIEVADASG